MKPSSWGHTVGLVLKFAGEKLIELREDCGSKELCVEGSDAVDSVRTDDGHVGHANLLVLSLLD